jgi:glutathione S-transferase
MGTPGILLYYHPHSFYSQKVVMALHEKKIPFQTRFINICAGKQFSDEFLSLNPRGEVPVLLDDNIRGIPGSAQIIDYLEDNFSNGHPRLRPEEPDLKHRCDQLTQLINALRVEALTYGTAFHGLKDLAIYPKSPYSHESQRKKTRDLVENRHRILRDGAKKFPSAEEGLKLKLKDIEYETPLATNREQYEGLILQFEKVMDECEAELVSHDNKNWWLVSPHLSMADISLGILLFRLWQLGFEKRMWEHNRPSLDAYFKRIKQLESFKKATSMNAGLDNLIEFLQNPYTLGAIGASALAVFGYYVVTNRGKAFTNPLAAIWPGLGKTELPSNLQGRPALPSPPTTKGRALASGFLNPGPTPY